MGAAEAGSLESVGLLARLRRLASEARRRYHRAPPGVHHRRRWAIRRALLPWLRLPMWVRSSDGTRFWLGPDPVADKVLFGLLGRHAALYFPPGFEGDAEERLLVDLGAHHGFWTVEALRRFPRARALAVEPNPSSLATIEKVLEGNGVESRCRVVGGAVGGEAGIARLHFGATGSWGDSLFEEAAGDGAAGQGGDAGGVDVPVHDLVDLLGEAPAAGRVPDLLKCNAEGAEFALFPRLFEAGILPRMVILMAHPEYGDVEALLDTFRDRGYTITDAGSTPKRTRLHCRLERRLDRRHHRRLHRRLEPAGAAA